jgi:hypothetical protein
MTSATTSRIDALNEEVDFHNANSSTSATFTRADSITGADVAPLDAAEEALLKASLASDLAAVEVRVAT